MSFRKDFLWGSATASYQVEGAWNNFKQPSIWDIFSHEGAHIKDGGSGDVTCSHYNLYKEDVSLMASLGLKAYRFSIAWTRIFTFDGMGKNGIEYHENPDGIAFYNALIDELVKNNITPFITLYHWDLPYALHLRGGWLNRDSSVWFEDYARTVGKLFGDRVKHFITFNEPSIFTGLGYMQGVHAPGFKLDTSDLLNLCHNVQLSHGKAVKALRETVENCSVGITLATSPVIPSSLEKLTVEQSYNVYFSCSKDNFVWSESFWVDPLILGEYPKEFVKEVSDFSGAEIFNQEDLKEINVPLDFIGLNIYSGRYYGEEKRPFGSPHTDTGWDITPEALRWGPEHFYKRYKLPVYITENGMACLDSVFVDGKIHDAERIDYLTRYLRCLKEACENGCDIRGYFMWSFMDNFEWAEGFSRRFGMVYVDYKTLERIPKDSALWYSNVVKTNGEEL